MYKFSPVSYTQAHTLHWATHRTVRQRVPHVEMLPAFSFTYARSSMLDAAINQVGCVLDFRDSKGLEYVSPCQTHQGGSSSPWTFIQFVS